jgi:protein SCO1/2
VFCLIAMQAIGAPGVKAFDASLNGLVDESGTVVGSERFAGKFRLVTFGFTSCADVCPMTLMAVRQALDKVGANAGAIAPIFISVDHERDTPRRLGDYVKAFDRRLIGLTGPPEVLLRVAKGHRVFFEKKYINAAANAYVYDHSAQILIVTPDGRLASSVSTAGTPADVADRVVRALRTAGVGASQR